MDERFDVIVVGGGLAGLAAGATAARAGARAVVLEAHRPGGRAQTTEREGFVFNRGVHALFAGGVGVAVLDSLGIRPTGAAPPMEHYRLVAGGAQHPLPLGPAAGGGYFDRGDAAQFAGVAHRLATADPSALAGVSVSAWLGDQDLRPRVDAVVRALFRLSTYAADLDHFAADAAVAQQQVAARAGVIYVHGGWSQLVDALAAKVEVRTGTQVRGVNADASGAVVETAAGPLVAGAVVVAAGTPAGARGLLPQDPAWGLLGDPVTAACLDAGLRRVPSPGYVVALDEPLYGTIQSPPARQAPDGGAVAAVIRYGARSVDADRPQLEAHLRELGVDDEDIVTSRFLARMVVSGAMPTAASGGLRGRPAIDATGLPNVYLAGDWVGPIGILSDAALASGQAAALAAVTRAGRASAA